MAEAELSIKHKIHLTYYQSLKFSNDEWIVRERGRRGRNGGGGVLYSLAFQPQLLTGNAVYAKIQCDMLYLFAMCLKFDSALQQVLSSLFMFPINTQHSTKLQSSFSIDVSPPSPRARRHRAAWACDVVGDGNVGRSVFAIAHTCRVSLRE